MRKIKKLAAAIGAGALLAASFLPALAATEAGVAATVTPKLVSVSVSPTSVNYGTLAVSTDNTTRTTKLSSEILLGPFTATNDGNVTETFNIKGTDATGDTTWTLNYSPAPTGTVALNQYVHRYDEGAVFADLEAKALSTGYLLLKSGVAPGTVNFVLQMNMPTSTTGYGQRSSTVTVLATE